MWKNEPLPQPTPGKKQNGMCFSRPSIFRIAFQGMRLDLYPPKLAQEVLVVVHITTRTCNGKMIKMPRVRLKLI
jgi:hypothetical protein